jgi:hypothetical protein
MALAAVYALNNHAFFVDSSVYVQRLLAEMVEQAPQINPDAVIVVVDDALLYHSHWRLDGHDDALSGAVGHIFGRPVQAFFCGSSANNLDDPRGIFYCEFRPHEISRIFSGRESVVTYDRVIVFTTKPGGEVELMEQIPAEWMTEAGAEAYHPDALIDRQTLPAARTTAIFTCWPLDKCFPLNQSQEYIRINFDRLIRGTGWQEPSPDRHTMWMNATRIKIIVNPVMNKPLVIRFHISQYFGQDIIDSLKLEVNGQPIVLEEMDNGSHIYRGIIPPSRLTEETQLTFLVNQLEGASLGLEFDWLEIQPAPES